MSSESEVIDQFVEQEYKWGFYTDVETDTLPPGLNEDVIRHISAKKEEPEWLLDWRLKAFRLVRLLRLLKLVRVLRASRVLAKYETSVGRTCSMSRLIIRASATTPRRARRTKIGQRVWMRWIPSC